MNASDTTALVLAVAANLAGLAIIARMWSRSRPRRRAVHLQHPSVRPPLTVGLVVEEDRCDVRIDTLAGSPRLAIDIVSFRHADHDGAWDSVPLTEPVEIAPGGHHQMSTTLPAETTTADVVVAWTARHPTGDVRGSHLFRLPPARDHPVPLPSSVAMLGGSVALGLSALLIGAAVLAVAPFFDSDEGRSSEPELSIAGPPANESVTTASTPDVTTGGVAQTTEQPITDTSTTATTSTTTTSTTATSTTATSTTATTTATSTTAAVSTPTTVPTTGTSPATTATTAPPVGPRVLVEGRIGPCRFGDDCLIVGFVLDDFASDPQEYICEFEDGSRFEFSFDAVGVATACATSTEDAAITVEIDGVRSDAVTRADATTG